MISTRVLTLLLLFLIILAGFLIIFRSSIPFLRAPRRDTIPVGTYIIPWMRPNPSIAILDGVPPSSQPWDLSQVMKGALAFDVTFRVGLPNGTRVVPSTIYLGHDQEFLYVGGKLGGAYSNPTSNSTVQFHDRFNLLLDTDNDGFLTYPESGSAILATIQCPFFPSECGLGRNGWGAAALAVGYGDMSWYNRVPLIQRAAWDVTGDICSYQNMQYTPADGDFNAEYDVWNGTLVFLFSRHLSLSGSCANGLQMGAGERWVMGFTFEFGYTNGFSLYQDFMDGWPANVYPYLSHDTSTWPRLVVDLANPST